MLDNVSILGELLQYKRGGCRRKPARKIAIYERQYSRLFPKMAVPTEDILVVT